MVLVTLVLGHELTYLIANGPHGYEAAMRAGGHEGYWTTFVLAVGALVTVLTIVVVGSWYACAGSPTN